MEGFYVENAFAYIDQLDKHAARLTVAETFEFACQCKTGGRLVNGKVDKDLEELNREADKEHVMTKIVLAGLDLTGVKDTFVGDTNVRGVSGGQRRRVTVGEVRKADALDDYRDSNRKFAHFSLSLCL